MPACAKGMEQGGGAAAGPRAAPPQPCRRYLHEGGQQLKQGAQGTGAAQFAAELLNGDEAAFFQGLFDVLLISARTGVWYSSTAFS